MDPNFDSEHIFLKVLTPHGTKFGDYVKIVNIETVSDGFEGFMKRHIPMVSEITIGQLSIRDKNNKKHVAAISGGFLYNDGNEIKILTPWFEFLEFVNRDQIVQKIANLQNKLLTPKDDHEKEVLSIALDNEKNKLKAIDNTIDSK